MHSRHKAASIKKRPEAFWVYEETGLPHPFAELAATRKVNGVACEAQVARSNSRARTSSGYLLLFQHWPLGRISLGKDDESKHLSSSMRKTGQIYFLDVVLRGSKINQASFPFSDIAIK